MFAGFKLSPTETLHTCVGLAGLPTTGQAGAIVTALTDPDGVASTLAVTVTEVGTTGRYRVSFTPDVTGTWLLEVTDPAAPTTAGQRSAYALEILPRVLFRPRLYAGYRNTGTRAYLKR